MVVGMCPPNLALTPKKKIKKQDIKKDENDYVHEF